MEEEETVEELPRHVYYYHQAKDLALGVHPLSHHIPPLFLLFDALLTSLVICKVPCESRPHSLQYPPNIHPI